MDRAQIDDTLEQVQKALSQGNWNRAVALVETLRPPDQADLFGELPPTEQDQLLPRLDLEDSADILEELEEEEAAEIATRLKAEELAHILDEMEPDEAADLLGDIAPEKAVQALAAMEESEQVRPLLVHADESAGGLMTSVKIMLHKEMTAEGAIAYLRATAPESEDVYYLFVVDQDVRIVGVVSLRQLVVVPPWTRVTDIMDPSVISVRADADQEKAARLMARYDLLALPVVDEKGHLLGLITHDDLVEILEDEATEDIYRLGGVLEEQPSDIPIPAALRARLPWLVLNLGTALASAAILSLFEGTIARVAVLAAFFPIVAGVSGSAGTQTLTVTVRGLALGELDPRDGLRALLRETLIGLVNGVAVGGLIALIALAWKGTPMLGIVVGLATLLNMIGAGIAGALIPVIMQVLRFDPALASPILVTTITDTCGYFIYLGLATLILTRLI
ncbi:MAG: magnesium transporter [Chloroflexi bacterium]|nr:MAG: magnesium transporter [Chloroflexota bacterium]